MGYSPHIGFIHSGSPLPFVYDLADLYKEHLCIDLAFSLTLETGRALQQAQSFRCFSPDVSLKSDLLGKDRPGHRG